MDTNKNQPAFQITTNLNHLHDQTTHYAKYDNQVRSVPLSSSTPVNQSGSGSKKKKTTTKKINKSTTTKKRTISKKK